MNPDPVEFPDVELVVGTYLEELLDVPVLREVEDLRPASFVVVQRLGGVRHTIVSDKPRIGYEAWAPTREDANALGALVQTLLANMKSYQVDGYGPVYRVDEVRGPTPDPDPLTGTPRSTGAALIHLRGRPYDPDTSE